MSRPTATRQAGFTLIEMLISISVFLVAVFAITMAFDSTRRSYLRGEVKINVQQNARQALTTMATEIRMAGYFPENFDDPAADPPLVNPVQIATEAALAVHGDIDGSGTSNVFLYCLDGSTLRRGRAPDGDTTAYWCPAADVLAENVTGLRFDYFDENNAPIPSTPGASFRLDGQDQGSTPDLSDVTERSAARRVEITITVRESVPMQAEQIFRIGTEVRLRNAD